MISQLFESTTISVRVLEVFQIENGYNLKPVCCTIFVVLLDTLLISAHEWFLATHRCGLKFGNLRNHHGRSGRNHEPLPPLHILADPLVQFEATSQAGLPRISFQSSESQE